MKVRISFCILLLVVMLGCKRKDNLTEPNPQPEPGLSGPLYARDFLKDFAVTGAGRITFDSITNSYMVSLPDNFKFEEAEVKLGLQPNVSLVDSLNQHSPETVIRYAYMGNRPLSFLVRNRTNDSWFSFSVYFNFAGTPQIELLNKLIPVNAGAIRIPVRFKARMGSIPHAPGEVGIGVKLTNSKTGASTAATVVALDGPIAFPYANQLLTGDPFALEIQVYNQTPVVFEGIRFNRDTPIADIVPAYQVIFAKTDTIKVSGGYFLPQQKYTMSFSNDFMDTPVSAPMQFVDSSWIHVNKIPANLPEGAYLASVYEGETLVANVPVFIGSETSRPIESIWQGNIALSTIRNPNRPSLGRGTEFYAKALPVEYGSSLTNFDVNKLPRLRFQSANKTVDLAPQLTVYNWAIAGVSYPLGKYKIPADLPSGRYTVTGIYADGTQTKPYWSRVDVK